MGLYRLSMLVSHHHHDKLVLVMVFMIIPPSSVFLLMLRRCEGCSSVLYGYDLYFLSPSCGTDHYRARTSLVQDEDAVILSMSPFEGLHILVKEYGMLFFFFFCVCVCVGKGVYMDE